jgi:cytochrome bd-type quinol oxidase subunit 2
MEDAITQSIGTGHKAKGLTRPLVALVLPVALLVPYWWFVFHFASDSICTPRIGKEHQGVHLFFFWILTYFPFAAVCFLSSVVMLARRARQDSRARTLLFLACLCVFGVVCLLVLLLFA